MIMMAVPPSHAHGRSWKDDVHQRVYTGLPTPADVDMVVKAGDEFIVRVTVINTSTRHHVAIVDHLAAGFEHAGRLDSNSCWSHTEKYDNRVQWFFETMYPSEYILEYKVLAATPGEFLMPPAKAEEMYCEETYGRCATQMVKVADEAELYELRTRGHQLEVKLYSTASGAVESTHNIPHPGAQCTIAELQQQVLRLTSYTNSDDVCLFGTFEEADNSDSALRRQYAATQTLMQAGIVLTALVKLD